MPPGHREAAIVLKISTAGAEGPIASTRLSDLPTRHADIQYSHEYRIL